MFTWAFGFKGPQPKEAEQFEEILPDIVGTGFTWIEVLAPEAKDLRWEALLQRWTRAYGLRVSVHARFFGVNLASPNPHVRQAALAVAAEDIAFAARVGACRINFHAGDVNWYDVPPPGHPEYERLCQGLNSLRTRYFDAAQEALRVVAVQARDAGLLPLVENLYRPWELIRTPEEARAFLNALPSGLGFTLDTGHALLAGYTPGTFLRVLGKRVRHLHVHVNDRCYDYHAFPHLNDEAIREMVSLLSTCAPDAVLLVEITPGTHHGALEDFRAWPQHVMRAAANVASYGDPTFLE